MGKSAVLNFVHSTKITFLLINKHDNRLQTQNVQSWNAYINVDIFKTKLKFTF